MIFNSATNYTIISNKLLNLKKQMKRKTKLVFTELERELSIIPHHQMLNILGGGSVDTIDQVVQWASDMGIPFTVNGQSQYTDSNGNILLSPVDVYSWANNQNTGHNPYSTTTIPPAFPHEEDIKRSYVQYFESLGYEMIQNEDGSYYCASAPYQPNYDPWKRDANGNIQASRTTTEVSVYDVYGDNALLEEYELTAHDGSKITAYKVIGIKDRITGAVRPANDNEKSNCIGYALAGGDYMFADNLATPQSEGNITRGDFASKFGYIECNKEDADVVMVYTGTGSSSYVTHAGIVNPDGTYDAKGGGSQYYIRTGMTEDEFFKPYPPVTDPETGEVRQLDYRPADMEQVVYYRLR